MFDNLFQHWEFWLVATLLVLIFLLVAKERGFRDKLNGSIDGKKYWIGFDAVWLEKNFSRLIGFIVGAGLVLMVIGCSGSSVETPPPVAALNCEGTYTATVDMPDHEARIASRNTSLTNAGHSLTNADGTPRSEAELNAILGGGTPDGGIYLSGSARWTTGAQVGTQCPITGGEVNIFGHQFAVTGGINNPALNPEFGFAFGGGPVTGRVNGSTFTGRVSEGGNPHVHGVLNGTFVPAGKI